MLGYSFRFGPDGTRLLWFGQQASCRGVDLFASDLTKRPPPDKLHDSWRIRASCDLFIGEP